MSVTSERLFPPGTGYGTILRISIGLEEPGELWSELETLFRALNGERKLATKVG